MIGGWCSWEKAGPGCWVTARHPWAGPTLSLSCSPHRVTLARWASQEWLASSDPRYRVPFDTVPLGALSIYLPVHLFVCQTFLRHFPCGWPTAESPASCPRDSHSSQPGFHARPRPPRCASGGSLGPSQCVSSSKNEHNHRAGLLEQRRPEAYATQWGERTVSAS